MLSFTNHSQTLTMTPFSQLGRRLDLKCVKRRVDEGWDSRCIIPVGGLIRHGSQVVITGS